MDGFELGASKGHVDLDGSDDQVDGCHDNVDQEHVLVVSRELFAEHPVDLVPWLPVDKVNVVADQLVVVRLDVLPPASQPVPPARHHPQVPEPGLDQVLDLVGELGPRHQVGRVVFVWAKLKVKAVMLNL